MSTKDQAIGKNLQTAARQSSALYKSNLPSFKKKVVDLSKRISSLKSDSKESMDVNTVDTMLKLSKLIDSFLESTKK